MVTGLGGVPMALLYQKELAEELDVDLTGALSIKGTDLFSAPFYQH